MANKALQLNDSFQIGTVDVHDLCNAAMMNSFWRRSVKSRSETINPPVDVSGG